LIEPEASSQPPPQIRGHCCRDRARACLSSGAATAAHSPARIIEAPCSPSASDCRWCWYPRRLNNSQRLLSLAAGHQEGRQGDGVRAVSDHRPALTTFVLFGPPPPPAAPDCTIRTEAVTEITLRFCPSHLAQRLVDRRGDRNGATYHIRGAHVAECPNLEDLQKLWEVGEGHRHVGATKMNAGTKHAAGCARQPPADPRWRALTCPAPLPSLIVGCGGRSRD
jgi:hypothetical protein